MYRDKLKHLHLKKCLEGILENACVRRIVPMILFACESSASLSKDVYL